jgi:hypothetical protein
MPVTAGMQTTRLHLASVQTYLELGVRVVQAAPVWVGMVVE